MSSWNIKMLMVALGLFASLFCSASESTHSIFEFDAVWNDDRDQKVQLSAWKDHYVAITMFYTTCRKFCPTVTLAKMREIERVFKERNISADYILITFDPENDTPKELARYRKTQELPDPHWHFLTASEETTRQFADKMGLGGYYAMDDHITHDFRILVFDDKGHSVVVDWKHRDVRAAMSKL